MCVYNSTATSEIYTYVPTLYLHASLPSCDDWCARAQFVHRQHHQVAVARPLKRAPRGLDLVQPGFDRVVTNAGFAQRLAHDPRDDPGLAPALVAADVLEYHQLRPESRRGVGHRAPVGLLAVAGLAEDHRQPAVVPVEPGRA